MSASWIFRDPEELEKMAAGSRSELFLSLDPNSNVTVIWVSESPVAILRHTVRIPEVGFRSFTCNPNDCLLCELHDAGVAAISRPTARYFATVIPTELLNRGEAEPRRLWGFGKRDYRTLRAYAEQVGGLRGKQINIVRTGEGRNTSYAYMVIGPIEDQSILEKYPDLNYEELLAPIPREQLQEILQDLLLQLQQKNEPQQQNAFSDLANPPKPDEDFGGPSGPDIVGV